MRQVKMTSEEEIAPLGERALLHKITSVPDMIDCAHHAQTLAKAARNLPFAIEAVAGLDSVALKFDPKKINMNEASAVFFEIICNTKAEKAPAPEKRIDLPICYADQFSPDLPGLADICQLTAEEIISRHTAKPLRVLAIGFAPGFSYLGENAPGLNAPRLDIPRKRVEAGSVGIAGSFTGIYPFPSPGGWHLIGRTPLPLYDPDRHEPFLLTPGMEVTFQPISTDEFVKLAS